MPATAVNSLESGVPAAGPTASTERHPFSSSGGSTAAASSSAEILVRKPADTRVYSTSRVNCWHGYEEEPVTVEGMRFELLDVLRYNRRDVESPKAIRELWSPNSLQHAYLPGFEADDFDAPALLFQQRRWDGHWGPFDAFVSPQYDAEANSPWTPFVRHAHTWRSDPLGRCLVTPVHAIWKVGADGVPCVAPDFVENLRRADERLERRMVKIRSEMDLAESDWITRPKIPANRPMMEELESLTAYEDAVDHAAIVQRILRGKDAWISMALALKRVPMDLDALRGQPYPLADERYLGLWANDAHEEYVLWLLAVGVPIFIHHRYEKGEILRSDHSPSNRAHGFLDMTSAALLLTASGNGFQFIAEREQFPVTTEGLEERGLGKVCVHANKFSSSQLLEARRKARIQGIELPTTPPRHRSPEEKFTSKALDLVVLVSWRMPWIQPPIVLSGAGAGKWEKWVQYESATTPPFRYLRRRAHNWQPTSSHVVRYDRENRRELYLRTDHVGPLGLVNQEVFGAPAPHERYFLMVQKGGESEYVQTHPSHWVYETRTSGPGDAGRKPPTPEARLLPPCEPTEEEPKHGEGPDDDDDDDGGMSDDDGEPPAPPAPAAAVTSERETDVYMTDVQVNPAPAAQDTEVGASPVDDLMPLAVDTSPVPAAAPASSSVNEAGRAVGSRDGDNKVSLGDVSEEEKHEGQPTGPRRHSRGIPQSAGASLPHSRPSALTLAPVSLVISPPRALAFDTPLPSLFSWLPLARTSEAFIRLALVPLPIAISETPVLPLASPPAIARTIAATSALSHEATAEPLSLKATGESPVRSVRESGASASTALGDRLSSGMASSSTAASSSSAPRYEQIATPLTAPSVPPASLAARMSDSVVIPLRQRLASPPRVDLTQRLALPGLPLMDRMTSKSSATQRLMARLAVPLSERVRGKRKRLRKKPRGRRTGKHNRKRSTDDDSRDEESDDDGFGSDDGQDSDY
ncbi:hypothetical protein FB451DRAFT_1408463 [Mycena latifolia]|nr:hypothetical protein FB451DRAFT_1408463 [Mycena latifolia]